MGFFKKNQCRDLSLTSMSVLLIVGPKCTLAASLAVAAGEYADGTYRQTDGRTDGRTDTRPLHYATRPA